MRQIYLIEGYEIYHSDEYNLYIYVIRPHFMAEYSKGIPQRSALVDQFGLEALQWSPYMSRSASRHMSMSLRLNLGGAATKIEMARLT